MNKRAILVLLAVSGLMVCLSFAQEVVRLDGAAGGNCQAGWRWCSKCDGLHFILNGLGACPAGGTHSTSGSGPYVLIDNDPAAPGDHGWRYCFKCRGLFFPNPPDNGVCPAGGAHFGTGSGVYCTIRTVQAEVGQGNWRWCCKCRGLHYAASAPYGTCPAGGQHSTVGSPYYSLVRESQLPMLWGKVTDSDSQPVAGAQVKATKGGTTRKTKTKADGTYCISGVASGKNTVKASKKNLGEATETIRVKKGDAKSTSLQLKK